MPDHASSGGPNPAPSDQLRRAVRIMIVIIPLTVVASVGAAYMIKHGPGFACRAKGAAGSVFDIDWCRAGAAAVRGAATGVATGAGARR
jgi:hypothetical protein